MSFEDVIGTVMQWATATEALAAVGAELALAAEGGGSAPPEIVAALQAVSTAAGLADLDDLAPPQRAMLAGIVRLYLHQALDVIEHPDRAPGWTYTDPAILDGWGRGSMMVPGSIAAAHADLADVGSFLDVGTGVGLLAVAAASVWPNAAIVGIDPWDASLERARANITQAGLDERVTLRPLSLTELDEVDTYDCAWVPTFFVGEDELERGVAPVVRSVRPGGWVVLGRMRPAPNPLAEAVVALRTTRSGGTTIDAKRAADLLEQAGCTDVHVPPPAGPSPLEFVLGQRPG
jgi:SAM-dependent methyltransferase